MDSINQLEDRDKKKNERRYYCPSCWNFFKFALFELEHILQEKSDDMKAEYAIQDITSSPATVLYCKAGLFRYLRTRERQSDANRVVFVGLTFAKFIHKLRLDYLDGL